MIKSMTGFGRSEYSDGKRNIVCEIKSVNHRYSDITIKMPRRYSFAEDKIKQAVKEKLAEYFKHRGLDTELIFLEASMYSSAKIEKQLSTVTEKYPDCVLDITGGTDAEGNTAVFHGLTPGQKVILTNLAELEEGMEIAE